MTKEKQKANKKQYKKTANCSRMLSVVEYGTPWATFNPLLKK